MRLIGVLVAWALAAALATPGAATEPDFYLVMKKCRTVAGYLVLSDESLRVTDGEPVTSACVRNSGKVSCSLSFEGGGQGLKGNLVEYEVVADSPPTLLLVGENGSEFISINTTERAAVVVSRIASLKHAGSKVCHGVYATSFDLKGLEK